MKKLKLIISLKLLFGFFLVLPLNAAKANTIPRVLVVGDSWAQLIWYHRSLGQVFKEMGFSQFSEKGEKTALGNTRADQWIKPKYFDLIIDEMNRYPSIDTVFLSLGGNDMIDEYHTSLPPEMLEQMIQRVRQNLYTLIRRMQVLRPGLKVVICGYDYGNFEDSLKGPLVKQKWQRMGRPTTSELNINLVRLEYVKKQMAASLEHVYYVHNLGLMQYTYGYPRYGLPPGAVPFPGSQTIPGPFPGGNILIPSPPLGMLSFVTDFINVPPFNQMPGLHYVDNIHLSKYGFYQVARNAFVQFIARIFMER